MRQAIIKFFTKNIKSKDTLLFYFSGHGVPDGRGDTFLATSDIDSTIPFDKGFSVEELSNMMGRSISTRKVTMLDCCYSGAAGIGIEGKKGGEQDNAKLGAAAIEKKSRILEQGEGSCLLAASLGAEQAYGLKQEGHSLFTYYLLEGLKGAKGEAVDINGRVTPDSLGSYVFEKVTDLVPDQRPIKKIQAAGNIILAYYPELGTITKEIWLESLLKLIREGNTEEFNRKRQQFSTWHLDFSREDLHGIRIPAIDLSNANLSKANLTKADLEGANLSNANLFKVDLEGANLSNANLSHSDLTEADLTYANLCNANLENADLTGADLKGVDLTNSNLTGADLKGAFHIEDLISRTPIDAAARPAKEEKSRTPIGNAMPEKTNNVFHAKESDNSNLIGDAIQRRQHLSDITTGDRVISKKPFNKWIIILPVILVGVIGIVVAVAVNLQHSSPTTASTQQTYNQNNTDTLQPTQNVFTLMDKGNALYNQGNYAQAIQYYDKALAIDPNNKDALNLKSSSLYNSGNYTQAIPYINKALSIDPNYEYALSTKGDILNGLQNYSQAISYYDKVLAIDPNSKYALTGKGNALDGLGYYAQAIQYYDKALAIDPNYKYALYDKGNALYSQGNYAQAIQYYDKALAIDPNNKDALNNKQNAVSKMGNVSSAAGGGNMTS